MAENKKGIIVYADWIDKFEFLTDEEAGKLIKHFFRYVNDQNPVAPDRFTESNFIDIKNCLKRDLKKWESRAERSRVNGSKGGRPKIENPEKPEETQQVILKPGKPDSVSVSVTTIYSEWDFLKDWSDIRKHYLKLESFITKLNFQEKQAFNRLCEIHDRQVFMDGLEGLLMQKEMFPATQSRPLHLLENFDKFVDAFRNKTQLFESKKIKEERL